MRYPRAWVALPLLLCCLSVSCWATEGVVVTAEGQRLAGVLSLSGDGSISVKPADGDASVFALGDLERVLLRPDLSPGKADIQLINNDGVHTSQTTSQSIKLKAGLHRVTIAYWQQSGPQDLRLEYQGPDIGRQVVTGSVLFNVRDEAEPPVSPGFDAQGFRIPENPEAPRPRMRYRFMTGDDTANWGTVEVFSSLTQKRTGTTDQISLRVANETSNFGILFSGYIKIAADGEYTFHLTSDDGAVMWLGKDPPLMSTLGQGATDPATRPWKVVLTDQGRIAGKLTEWTQTLGLDVPHGEATLALRIPRERVQSLWAEGYATPDRLGEAQNEDHAYIARQPEGQPLEVRRVSGKAVGIEGNELLFEFRGEQRRIAMDKLVGVVFAPPAAAGPRSRSFSLRFDLLAGHVLPGSWKSLDEQNVTLTTTWGQDITVPTSSIAQVRMIGGRLIYLADSEPDDIRQTPYFDRVLPVRRNQSIGGMPLEIYQGGFHSRGFAVAGRTLLHFNLGGSFERLLVDVGLHKPEGELGDVDIRVVGDGRVLFERKGLTAADPPVAIDLELTGVNQLTLETDFGGGQDVGDRVVWGDPRVIRERQPTSE